MRGTNEYIFLLYGSSSLIFSKRVAAFADNNRPSLDNLLLLMKTSYSIASSLIFSKLKIRELLCISIVISFMSSRWTLPIIFILSYLTWWETCHLGLAAAAGVWMASHNGMFGKYDTRLCQNVLAESCLSYKTLVIRKQKGKCLNLCYE